MCGSWMVVFVYIDRNDRRFLGFSMSPTLILERVRTVNPNAILPSEWKDTEEATQ